MTRYVLGEPDAQRHALRVLGQGGVVVLPTDTIPGLSATASSERGVARIREIKGSADEKQFVLLVASVEMAQAYVGDFGCTTRAVLERVWPAPLSAVFRSGGRCPRWVGPTVALRVPDLAPLRGLIAELGEAIVSTSVNRSGESPETLFDSIEKEFGFEVDALVTAPYRKKRASTLVDFTGAAPKVLRKGDYDWPAAATGDSKPSK